MTAVAVVLAGLCAVWALEAALEFRNLGRLEDLARLHPAAPAAWPRVSVVTPARDEAAGIARSLESRLADGYPDLEVVVVDDRSGDETPLIIADLLARGAARGAAIAQGPAALMSAARRPRRPVRLVGVVRLAYLGYAVRETGP